MPRTLEQLRRLASPARALALAALAQAAPRASAQVVTDGSLGAAGPVSRVNGTYSIPDTLGRRHGANLFHSFSRLDLAAGETASFSGPAAVTNVLARVTGGQPSSVDGTLRCTIPNASFYLVNPAGVVFGPNASIDVGGSFAVTTADFIRLADGRRFEVTGASDALLTTAPPAAFGFLGSTRAPVAANGARLGVPESRVLSVAGGDVRLAGARIDAPGGRVNLAAVASAGEVRLDPLGPGTGIDVLAPQQGNIEITGGSVVDVSANSAGHVSVRAATLRLEDSNISARTGSGNGGDIDLIATGTADIVSGGLVATDATLGGAGGRVSLAADRALIDPRGSSSVTGIRSRTQGSGAGGEISLVADSLDILGGGQIHSQTSGAGVGGNVRVDVNGTALLDGPLTEGPYTEDSLFSSIRADATRTSSSAATGGDVFLTARNLRVNNLAFVSATTNGGGAGGDAQVSARRIRLDGARRDEFTGIGANTQAFSNAGPGGDISIESESLSILRGAGVAARNFGPDVLGVESGGTVDVRASRLLRIDGRRTPSTTGITAEAVNARGGDVLIRAGRFDSVRGEVTAAARADPGNEEVADRGRIDVVVASRVYLLRSTMTAFASGSGGQIRIDPPAVVLSNSVINGIAQGSVPVFVEIEASALLRFRSQILTTTGETFPETDLSGAFAPVVAATVANGARLREICGVQTGGDVSSFIVTGRGGAPPEPGGWQSDWEVDLAAPRAGNR